MFDVGFVELLVIFVLGLLILGPERLPRVVSKLGRWIGKARRTASDLRRQLEREIELEEFSKSNRKPPRPPQRPSPFPPPDEAQAQGTENADSSDSYDSSEPSAGSIWPPQDAPSAESPASTADGDTKPDMNTGSDAGHSDGMDSDQRADNAAAGR